MSDDKKSPAASAIVENSIKFVNLFMDKKVDGKTSIEALRGRRPSIFCDDLHLFFRARNHGAHES